MGIIVGTNNSPGIVNSLSLKYINNNGYISNVKMAMPSKFYPSDNTTLFSNSRNVYINNVGKCFSNNYTLVSEYTKKKKTSNTFSSEVTYMRRVYAIGKSSIQSAATKQQLSFRSQDTTSINDALRRCRAGGCVAPKKKNANR